jgi:hypothetical protein
MPCIKISSSAYAPFSLHNVLKRTQCTGIQRLYELCTRTPHATVFITAPNTLGLERLTLRWTNNDISIRR